MDNIDLQILSILKDNARMKASAIANVVNLSVSAVTERIKKLETSGIIEKYTLMVDQKKIGNDVSAVIEVAIEHPRYIDSFINLVTSIPNIISCYCVTGDYDFILKVIIDSSEGLEHVANTYAVANRKSCKGKIVLLVDDILTTGATGDACAKKLLSAGAAQVFFLSAASAAEKKN